MEQYCDVRLVTCQGVTVALARKTGQTNCDTLYYNILDLTVGSESDADDWTGFKELSFPPTLRPAGMGLIELPLEMTGVSTADAPFYVVAEDIFVWVFRQSSNGTLLANRFVLKTSVTRDPAGSEAQQEAASEDAELILEPVWEARFQNTGQYAFASGQDDPQSVTDRDGNPYFEPVLELAFVDQIKDGRFALDLIAAPETGSRMWQIFVTDGDANSPTVLCRYAIPYTDSAAFDLSGMTLPTSGTSSPSFEIQPIETTAFRDSSNTPLSPVAGPTVTVFAQTERLGSGRDEAVLKRSMRLMFVQNTSNGMIAIDYGIGRSGDLAELPKSSEREPLELPAIEFSKGESLYFYPGQSVDLFPQGTVVGDCKTFNFSFWMRCDAMVGTAILLRSGKSSATENMSILHLSDDGTLSLTYVGGKKNRYSISLNRSVQVGEWLHITGKVALGGGSSGKTQSLELELTVDDGHSTVTDKVTDEVGIKDYVYVPQVICPQQELQGGDIPVAGGFQGIISGLSITATTLAGDSEEVGWPLDNISYVEPTGSNMTDTATTSGTWNGNSVSATLKGPKLVSTSSPAQMGLQPTLAGGGFFVDSAGLSATYGLADLNSVGSPQLLDSADGAVHLYYRETGTDRFSVARYETAVARARVGLPWVSGATGGTTTSGQVELIALQATDRMRAGATVFVSDSGIGDPDLCFFEVQPGWSYTGEMELWRELPRRLDAFRDVINGLSAGDPSDPDVVHGRATFYDPTGQYNICRLPTVDSDHGVALMFVDRQPDFLKLHSVNLQKGKLSLSFVPAGWSEGGIQLDWTLSSEDATTKSILADLNTVEWQLNDVGDLLVQCTFPKQKNGERLAGFFAVCAYDITLTFSEITLSDNTLQMTVKVFKGRSKTTTATITSKPEPSSVAKALNEYEDFKEKIAFIPFGKTLHWQEGDEVDVSVLNSGNELFFCAFQDGEVDQSLSVSTTANPARFYNQSFARFWQPKVSLSAASHVLHVMPAELPDTGYPALVQNTPGGGATMLAPGGGRGWVCDADTSALRLFPTDGEPNVRWYDTGPYASYLTPFEDFTAELWINSQSIDAAGDVVPVSSKVQNTNLLSVHDPDAVPDQPNRGYGWALELESIALALGNSSSNTAKFDWKPTPAVQDFSTVWRMKLGPDFVSSKASAYFKVDILSSSEFEIGAMITANAGSLTLSWGDIGSWDWPLDTDAGVNLERDWHHLALISGQDSTSSTFQLFLDGEIIGTHQVQTVGAVSGIALHVDAKNGKNFNAGVFLNDVSFWSEALDAAQVARDCIKSLPNTSPNLSARFPFSSQTSFSTAVGAAPGSCTVTIQLGRVSGGYYSNLSFLFEGRKVYTTNGRGLGLAGGWVHLAAMCKMGTAIQCGAKRFGNAGTDEALSPPDTLSIEAWIRPDESTNAGAILAREGAYELVRRPDGNICFTVQTSNAGPVSILSATPVANNDLVYVVVTAEARSYSVEDTSSSGEQKEKLYYGVDLKIYLNGVLGGTQSLDKLKDEVSLGSTEKPLFVGVGTRNDMPFSGTVGPIRIWGRVLDQTEITEAYNSRQAPVNAEEIVADWSFSEQIGRVARSVEGGGTLRLSHSDMWVSESGTSELSILIDGQEQELCYGEAAIPVSSGAGILAEIGQGRSGKGIYGAIAEFRLWASQRTAEQISDGMYRRLSGREDGLSGYWTFDPGSGNVVPDETGRGNVGWLSSDPAEIGFVRDAVPVGTEAPLVQGRPSSGEITTSVSDPFVQEIGGTPAVVEYVDLQKNAKGDPISVLKRCYMAPSSGADSSEGLLNFTGFKVGDLETVYIGQAQTRAKLVGFIEGAPPVPSENQTIPAYNSLRSYWRYAGNTEISVTASDSTDYTFSSSKELHSGHALDLGYGYSFKLKAGTAVGVVAQVEFEPVTVNLQGALKSDISLSSAHGAATGVSADATKKVIDTFSPSGHWETSGDVFSDTIGRRFIPDSTGYAVVKSRVANVYASRIAGTSTALKLTMVPDDQIPPDTNLIDFPLNPAYIQTGNLDGQIGYKKDPRTPESFYRPAEAYALKAEAERRDAEFANFYGGFDASHYAEVPNLTTPRGYERFTSNNWDPVRKRRSIVNTYVWSAGGGFHEQETSFSNTMSESFSGVESFTFKGGFKLGFEAVIQLNLDYTYDQSLTVHASKSRSAKQGFGLQARVKPEDWLYSVGSYETSGEPVFSSSPTPGTVDAYRFMAFHLPPSQENGDTFFANVIDPQWLNQSEHPNAAALRGAATADAGAWRVLYRTTYVSRTPPEIDDGPIATEAPLPIPAPRTAAVTWLTKMVAAKISDSNPTPEAIAAALASVFETDLATTLPWWQTFWNIATTDKNSDEAAYLTKLQSEALTWMTGHWLQQSERSQP